MLNLFTKSMLELRTVTITGSGLTSLSSIRHLKKLEVLDVRDNTIGDPEELFHLSKLPLQELLVSGNLVI